MRKGSGILGSILSNTLWSAAALAQGGPPLLTDDPGTPGDGNWEINLAFAVESLEDETTFEAPLLDINYGVGDTIQLKFELPWIFLHQDGDGTKNGLGNSAFGIKWRFLDEDPDGLSMSVYPQFQFRNPTSSGDRGIVDERMELFLPVQAQKTFGAVSVNPEIGLLVREGQRDQWVYGLAVGYQASPDVDLLGELHGTALTDMSDYDAVVNLGLRWHLDDMFTLLASAGTQLFRSGSVRNETEFVGYAGLQLTF
jgi:hypothetical protein